MSTALTIPNTFTGVTTATTPNLDADFAAVATYANDPMSKIVFNADTGTANAYVVALASPNSFVAATFGTYALVFFKAANAATGASTLTINPFPGTTVPLKKVVGSGAVNLGTGDILAGSIYGAIYDTTTNAWYVLNPSSAVNATIDNTFTGANSYFPYETYAVNTALTAATDNGKIIRGQGTVTLTLPDAGTGMAFWVESQAATDVITLARQTTATITVDGGNVGVTSYVLSIFSKAFVFFDGTNWNVKTNTPRVVDGATGGDPGPSGGVNFPDVKINGVSLAAGAGGASMVLLSSKTASNSASLNFTNADFSWTAYDEYVFQFVNLIPATGSNSFSYRVSFDGSTFQTGANYFDSTTGEDQNGNSLVGSSAGVGRAYEIITSVATNGTQAVPASKPGLSGKMFLFAPASAFYKQFQWKVGYPNSNTGNPMGSVDGQGNYQATNALLGISFAYGAMNVNIASGTIRVYGIKNS